MHSYDVKRAQAAFNLSSAWALITTEKPPPPDPPLPEYRLEPSSQVRGQARARRFLGGVGLLIGAVEHLAGLSPTGSTLP